MTSYQTKEQERFMEIQTLYSELEPLTNEERVKRLTSKDYDRQVVSEVKELLSMDRKAVTGKLTRMLEQARSGSSWANAERLIGTRVGEYRLVKVLGKGGSGVVYLAENRRKKYGGTVAIKIIEATSNPVVLQRFQTEHQILESLSHPNIAKLISIGVTSGNSPYLVMEYVYGKRIDEYCDEKQLTLEDRLRLFLQVCDAVQCAHRNLVVHRDLKPPNILISQEGEAKLLDFGIAKLVSTDTSSMEVTKFHERALTPEYASPEQLLGRVVSTAADIYSLGVILYELLAGMPPYVVVDKSSLELERVICVVDPQKPSTVVMRGADNSSAPDYILIKSAASKRQLEIKQLGEKLSGDLDAIVMRALRKEPESRYSTVEALSEDINNYLERKPVIARQGNRMYYAGRFIRRNVVPVMAVSVLAIGLTAATGISLFFFHRESVAYQKEKVQRTRAEAVSGFMTSIFAHANPYGDSVSGKDVRAVDLLEQASQRIDTLNDPEAKLSLLIPIGDSLLKLGQYSDAEGHFRQAAVLANQLHPDDVAMRGLIRVELATAEQKRGELDQAGIDYAKAKRELATHGDEVTPTYAQLLVEMGRLENLRGKLTEAAEYFQRAIAVMKKLPGDQTVEIALTLSDTGQLYQWAGEYDKAESLEQTAFQMIDGKLPEMRPERVFIQLKLADALSAKHEYSKAQPLIERSVKAERIMYHNSGPDLATSLNMLAWNREALGRHAEAEDLLKECLNVAEQSLGPDHIDTGYYLTSLARMDVLHAKYVEAEQYATDALAVFRKSLPNNHPYVLSAQYWLGEAFLGQNRKEEAAESMQGEIEGLRASKSPSWMEWRAKIAQLRTKVETSNCESISGQIKHLYKQLELNRGPADEATRMAKTALLGLPCVSGKTRTLY